MKILPKEAFAAVARDTITRHDEWDALAGLVSYYWDDGKRELLPATVVCFAPDIQPEQYPKLIVASATRELDGDRDHPAPCAYLFEGESFGMGKPGAGATAEYRERYERAARDRTFHEQPDAIEAAQVWFADMYGRFWSAGKPRANPDLITERFYPPGHHPGGSVIRAVLAAARLAGIQCHGLPPPGQGLS